jgi:hypothetical protein
MALGRRVFASTIEIKAVNLGREDEIALRQSASFVRINASVNLPPGERKVWMMTLLLGDFAHAIDKVKRLPKVGKQEAFFDVVFLYELPAR